jgi:hypothetical protein
MATVAGVGGAMQRVLTTTAALAARRTGAVQRVRKFTGPTLVQTLVFGWLTHPAATLDQLCQVAATRGVTITPQGLAGRLGSTTAACLEQVVGAAVTELVATEAAVLPLLDRFTAVVVQDSTLIRLPDELAATWAGYGGGRPTGGGTGAALKLQVGLDLRGGQLQGPTLHPGRTQDQRSALPLDPWPAGTLVLRDLGYFSLDSLAAQTAAGQWWVTRPKVNTAIGGGAGDAPQTTIAALVTGAGADQLDQPIALGGRQRLPCRLVAVRLPAALAARQRRKAREEARKHGRPASAARLALADWFVVVTNVPAALASAAEVLILARVRWQIELLFKRWKSIGRLDDWRSTQPWRILCEVYAKLIGLLIAHWVTLIGAWVLPNRSLWKALTVVQTHTPDLARTFDQPEQQAAVLATIARVQRATCRLTTRRTHPATWQRLTTEQAA